MGKTLYFHNCNDYSGNTRVLADILRPTVSGHRIFIVSELISRVYGFLVALREGKGFDTFYINTIMPCYAALAGRFAGKRIIYNDANLGFGRANNNGLLSASRCNVIFLNSDTLLRGNALKILCDFLDSNPEAGACGANLFTRGGTPNQSYMLYRPGIRAELARFFEIKGETFNATGRPR